MLPQAHQSVAAGSGQTRSTSLDTAVLQQAQMQEYWELYAGQ